MAGGDLGTVTEVMTQALSLFTNMPSWVPSFDYALTKFMAIYSILDYQYSTLSARDLSSLLPRVSNDRKTFNTVEYSYSKSFHQKTCNIKIPL